MKYYRSIVKRRKNAILNGWDGPVNDSNGSTKHNFSEENINDKDCNNDTSRQNEPTSLLRHCQSQFSQPLSTETESNNKYIHDRKRQRPQSPIHPSNNTHKLDIPDTENNVAKRKKRDRDETNSVSTFSHDEDMKDKVSTNGNSHRKAKVKVNNPYLTPYTFSTSKRTISTENNHEDRQKSSQDKKSNTSLILSSDTSSVTHVTLDENIQSQSLVQENVSLKRTNTLSMSNNRNDDQIDMDVEASSSTFETSSNSLTKNQKKSIQTKSISPTTESDNHNQTRPIQNQPQNTDERKRIRSRTLSTLDENSSQPGQKKNKDSFAEISQESSDDQYDYIRSYFKEHNDECRMYDLKWGRRNKIIHTPTNLIFDPRSLTKIVETLDVEMEYYKSIESKRGSKKYLRDALNKALAAHEETIRDEKKLLKLISNQIYKAKRAEKNEEQWQQRQNSRETTKLSSINQNMNSVDETQSSKLDDESRTKKTTTQSTGNHIFSMKNPNQHNSSLFPQTQIASKGKCSLVSLVAQSFSSSLRKDPSKEKEGDLPSNKSKNEAPKQNVSTNPASAKDRAESINSDNLDFIPAASMPVLKQSLLSRGTNITSTSSKAGLSLLKSHKIKRLWPDSTIFSKRIMKWTPPVSEERRNRPPIFRGPVQSCLASKNLSTIPSTFQNGIDMRAAFGSHLLEEGAASVNREFEINSDHNGTWKKDCFILTLRVRLSLYYTYMVGKISIKCSNS